MLLVEPDAGGTGDPFEDQCRLALAATLPDETHEALLEIRVIVQLQAIDNRRKRLARRVRQSVTISVVLRQSIRDDRLRHRLTTATAHRTWLAVDTHREIDAVRYRLTAMVAIVDVHRWSIQGKRKMPTGPC
jgi:hypothetical protein